MQPSHAATLGRAPRVPRTPQVLRPAPRGAAVAKAPAVPRSSLAFAAVTGAIAWKTWTARRQRAPQQVEKMNTKKLGLRSVYVRYGPVWDGFLLLRFGWGLDWDCIEKVAVSSVAYKYTSEITSWQNRDFGS